SVRGRGAPCGGAKARLWFPLRAPICYRHTGSRRATPRSGSNPSPCTIRLARLRGPFDHVTPPAWLEHDLGSADPFASQPCSLVPSSRSFGYETNQDGVLTAPPGLLRASLAWVTTQSESSQHHG